MFKKVFDLLKKLIVAVLIIYTYNKMAVSTNLFIPINIFSIMLVTFFGVPSIIMIVLFALVCI